MARKKKKNREERADEFHSLHQEFKRQTQGKLSRINPALKSLRIEYQFFSDGVAVGATKILDLTAADSAFFKLPCASPGCARGGFDIFDLLREALAAGQTACDGKAICHGVHDAERIGKRECLNEATFTVKAEYA